MPADQKLFSSQTTVLFLISISHMSVINDWYILNDRKVLSHHQPQFYQPIINYQQETLTKRNT